MESSGRDSLVYELGPLKKSTLHGSSIWPGDVGGFVALRSLNHVEEHSLAVAKGSLHLARVVFRDGRVVHEDVLIGVVPDKGLRW